MIFQAKTWDPVIIENIALTSAGSEFHTQGGALGLILRRTWDTKADQDQDKIPSTKEGIGPADSPLPFGGAAPGASLAALGPRRFWSLPAVLCGAFTLRFFPPGLPLHQAPRFGDGNGW